MIDKALIEELAETERWHRWYDGFYEERDADYDVAIPISRGDERAWELTAAWCWAAMLRHDITLSHTHEGYRGFWRCKEVIGPWKLLGGAASWDPQEALALAICARRNAALMALAEYLGNTL